MFLPFQILSLGYNNIVLRTFQVKIVKLEVFVIANNVADGWMEHFQELHHLSSLTSSFNHLAYP